MANPLHIKGSRTRVLNTFPTKNFGKDGDIVISRIPGKGVFLCTKAGGMWYVANKMEELRKHDRASISKLQTNSLSINKLTNAESNTDKILVSDFGVIKYITSEQISGNVAINDIQYKQAYCSLGQYTNKEDCETNNGTWYYSENDSHDSISSTAENELLTVASTLGKLDAEPTLLYDGSTLEIKRNTNYDDNWQTSAQTNLLKLSYDSDNYATFSVDSSGVTTIATVDSDAALGTLILDADGRIHFDSFTGLYNFYDQGGADDYMQIEVSSAGATAIKTIDAVGAYGHLTLDADGDIILDPNSGITKFYKAGDTNDLCTLTVSANGATTIATADNDGAVGHLTLDVDGDVILDPNSGITKFYLAGDTDDLCTLTVEANGATTIATTDSDGSNGILTLAPNGNLMLAPSTGAIRFYDSDNSADYVDFELDANGALHIETVDTAGSDANISLDADGDIILDADGGQVAIKDDDVIHFDFDCDNTRIRIYDDANTSDHLTIAVDSNGQSTIATEDNDGTAGNLILQPDGTLVINSKDGRIEFFDLDNTDDYTRFQLDSNGGLEILTVDANLSGADFVVNADGDIILDSHNGKFEAKKAGVEFSAEGSAYAGMILGYTRIQNDGDGGADAIISLTNTMTVLQTEQGTNVSVTFVAPPSGNVEIVFSCYIYSSSTTLGFALSDNATFNEINETHTYDFGSYKSDETDYDTLNIKWAVTGLTAGTSYTYYVAGDELSGSTSTIYQGRFRTSGLHAPPILVKAVALPATITTGE